MAHQNDGIFTQSGPDGIFGGGGDPLDASSPPIDSDDTPLRETLVVDFPSPGHMRVARATRHPKSGRTEMYEEYREPTPEEVEILARQGVTVGPGSMVTSMPQPMSPAVMPSVGGYVGATDGAPPPEGFFASQPWLKIGLGVAVGVAGFWAANKWVMPMIGGKREGEEVDEEIEEEVDA